jgi:putative CocE/NonD family hydrolase
MNVASHLLQRLLKLDPPITRDVIVQRGLRVPMPDGVDLLADRWAPRTGGDSLPVALIRTPYGRGRLLSSGMVRPLAERGFQVIVQSARGTFGSGGTFEPMRNEREDGAATLEWIVRQPWFGGSIVLLGLSYMGYVQWAVAGRMPPEVKAIIPEKADSAITLDFLRADGISLETPFGWGILIDGQERRGGMLRALAAERKNQAALATLPLTQADVAAVGHHVPYVTDILRHDSDDPYWAAIDHRERVAEVTVPVSSIAGWYDIFLPGQLSDFRILQSLGRPARLTVGPWTHLDIDGIPMREALTFGLACARGEEPPPRAPVRLRVMGTNDWRDFESWPPPGYSPRRCLLRPGGALALPGEQAGALSGAALSGDALSAGARPGEPATDRYRYDPADPTPAVGGVRMVRRGSGRVENTGLESRPDVLTYTTATLESDTEIIGEVSAEIWFRSSLPYADVFVRLCDVDSRGRSWNVCDGLTSLTGADAITMATVALWPTAYRFRRGHRIRIQVSSGAFPRYARNPGTGEPRATATRLLSADQEVYHDAAHPSAIILPVAAPDLQP